MAPRSVSQRDSRMSTQRSRHRASGTSLQTFKSWVSGQGIREEDEDRATHREAEDYGYHDGEGLLGDGGSAKSRKKKKKITCSDIQILEAEVVPEHLRKKL